MRAPPRSPRRTRGGRGGELRPPVLPLGVARRPVGAHRAGPLRRRARALQARPQPHARRRRRCASTTRSSRSNGWQSTHTAVEIVTDDMPFLIDSVSMELNRRGFGMHMIIHPVMNIRRDAARRARRGPAAEPDRRGGRAARVGDPRRGRPADRRRRSSTTLREHLLRVIAEVRAAVEDWPADARERALEIAAELGEPTRRRSDPEEVAEARAFVAWLEDHHFTFLGYRDYDLDDRRRRRDAAHRGARLRPRHPPPDERRALPAQLRRPAARGARARARAVPPQPHEGELARDRAPARVPRLRGREALRRRGPT